MKMLRSLLGAALLALAASPCLAATLISTATGNINATGTWSVVDTTGTNAFLNSETANTALTTSPVASSTFTPTAETVTAIGVKLASVAAAPTGTMTVKLANSTAPGTRECTQTVNAADLVSASASTAEGGWVILTCSAVPNGTDAYTITASTSSSSQVNLFSLATTNWSRLLVTSGTQASGPAAGDKFYVFGNLTGAGTHNAFTVTINTTSLTNYGNVANTLIDPSVAVGQWGTLAFGVTASTAFVSEFAGPMIIYNGGTFTVGTAGSRIPATGSATLTLNSSVEGDTGINVRNGGTFSSAGSSNGRNVVKTKLTATATAASTTVLTAADTTGWLSGDSIVIAGTQQTTGTAGSVKSDAATLSGNASGTSITLTAAVTNTHTATQLSYTSTSTNTPYLMNMYPDVILLNRNVIIQGSGANTNGYLYFQPSSNGAMDWTQFSLISGTVAGQRGIETDTGQFGTFSVTNSSFVNSHNSTMVLAPTSKVFGGTQATPLTIQHVVFYNCTNGSANPAYTLASLTTGFNPYVKIDDVTILNSAQVSANAISMLHVTGQFTNISFSGSGNGGTPALVINGTYGNTGILGGQVGNTWGPIYSYANTGPPVRAGAGAGLYGTIAGLYIWHEYARFQALQAQGELTFDPFYLITSDFGIYNSGNGSKATYRNGVIGWDSSTLDRVALQQDAVPHTTIFDNMEICPVGSLGGVTFVACNNPTLVLEADVTAGGGSTPSEAQVYLRNSSLLNNQGTTYPTQGSQETWYSKTAFIVQDCALCTPVKHAAWLAGGFISYDTAITHTSGYSLRMTPRVITFSGYISGTTLNITTTGTFTGSGGDNLTSNGVGFIPGTYVSALIGGSQYTVSQSQTVGSVGSPVQFQEYTNYGTLMRLQSAPYGMGLKVAVASGVSNAQACVWLRPSINTDAAPTWGGSAVTYNGDAPRMLVRQNPSMGVQSDTVIATSSPTAGTWGQLCGTLPTALMDGTFEVVIDADQTFTSNTGGSVNVAEWSCVNCQSPAGSQYWWNGTPMAAIVPASGGSSGTGAMIGGR